MASKTHNLFSVTIFGYRKPGMDEDAYHKYVSEVHAGHLKDLLVKNKIVSYHMQHNSTEGRSLISQFYPGMPEDKVHDADCVVQIVFKNVEDYKKVKNDEKYSRVIDPDHDNFADRTRTKFVTGWFEFMVTDGQVV